MKSLSPYLVKFSGLKEGIHFFDFEIGNKFFKNFDYYDFADANIKTIITDESGAKKIRSMGNDIQKELIIFTVEGNLSLIHI